MRSMKAPDTGLQLFKLVRDLREAGIESWAKLALVITGSAPGWRRAQPQGGRPSSSRQ